MDVFVPREADRAGRSTGSQVRAGETVDRAAGRPGPRDGRRCSTSGRRRRTASYRRGIYLLPSLFTVGNMFCGYACIVFAMRGELGDRRAVHRHRGRARHARRPHRADDEHDERVRRRVRLAGRRHLVRRGAGGAGVRVGAVGSRPGRLGGRLPVRRRAAAMRLARFNIQSAAQVDKRYFVGMPSPAAAGVAAATVFAWPYPLPGPARTVAGDRDRAGAGGADGQHDSLPQLQDDQLRLGTVVRAGLRVRGAHRVHRDRAAGHAGHPRLQLSAVGVRRDGGHAAAGAAGGGRRRQRHRHRRARRRARSSSAIVPPHSSMLRFAFASPRPEPAVLVEKYGSNARAHRLGVHADAGVGDGRSTTRPSSGRGRDRQPAAAGHRLHGVLDEVRERARDQRAIGPNRGQAARRRRRRPRCDPASAEPVRRRRRPRCRSGTSTGARRGLGSPAKFANSDAIWRSSRTCRRIGRHALIERPRRAAGADPRARAAGARPRAGSASAGS